MLVVVLVATVKISQRFGILKLVLQSRIEEYSIN